MRVCTMYSQIAVRDYSPTWSKNDNRLDVIFTFIIINISLRALLPYLSIFPCAGR